MRKLAIAAGLLLTGTIALSACAETETKEAAAQPQKEVKGQQKGESYESQTNIRYVDMDTLYAHYDYAVEQNKVMEQIALDLQTYQNQLGRQLQSKQAEMQRKMDSNAYTEATYKADMEELQRLDQSSSAQYARRAESDNARVEEIRKAVNDAIDSYIVEYNKEHKYDAILHKAAGLYFNPALDITGDLVKGLNEAYKAKQAKPATDKAEESK